MSNTPFKITIVAFLFLFHFSAFSQEEKTYDVKDFTKVSFAGNFVIHAHQGDTAKLVLKTTPDMFEKMKVKNTSGSLSVGVKEKLWGKSKNKRVEAHLYFMTLSSIKISGASTWIAEERLQFENLKLQLSGASKCDIKDLKLEKLNLDASGSSKIFLSGSADVLKLDLSGASKVNGQDFKCQEVTIDGSGASKVSIYVNKKLSVDLSGASKVMYYGEPKKVNSEVTGASKVLSMD